MSSPQDEYRARLANRRARVAAIDRTHLHLSNSRLVVAAVAIWLLWLAFGPATVSPWWPVAAAMAFGALVVAHARVIDHGDRAHRAARLYERGLDRLNGR